MILSNTAVIFLVLKMISVRLEWKVPENCMSWEFYLTAFRAVCGVIGHIYFNQNEWDVLQGILHVKYKSKQFSFEV